MIMRHIGKIPGEIDHEYLCFLKKTNGASILDYCFFGLKNNKLGSKVYNIMMDLWHGDNLLTLFFWGFSSTSTGEYFGYLNKKNEHGGHYIGYYSSDNPGKVYIIASSFLIFINKFISQIEAEIINDDKLLALQNNDWFMDLGKLIEDDAEIEIYIQHNSTEYLSTIYI